MATNPRFVDSPGDRVLSPATRAHGFAGTPTPVRGLTGGYILSPAERAHGFAGTPIPGSRRPVRGLTGGYILSPAARALSTQHSPYV
ncbi:MAG TPA: hypothetical protein VKM94_14940 [Blastocatellia bacterium]|nr:hypothetical protein [Blastocatellia bacterium]